MNEKAETCPVSSPLVLLNQSFEQVAAVFDGFEVPTRGIVVERGGHGRSDKAIRSSRANDDKVAFKDLPGHHVESSFTAEQRLYIGATVAALVKFARGELVYSKDERVMSLSDDIQSRFRGEGQSDTAMHFPLSLVGATLSYYSRFCQMYPNVTPALEATLRAGGYAGTVVALERAEDELCIALGIEWLKREKEENSLRSAYHFTGTHDRDEPTHEVWCLGESLGRGIITQAGRAAVELAKIPGIEAHHDPIYDRCAILNSGFREQVAETVNMHLESVRSAS